MTTAPLTANHTLASIALNRLGLSRDRALNAPILAVLGSLFIAASAQIAVPMWPVPATMQTLAVLLVGATLGARLGFAAVALYLLEGAMGMPVFAHMTGGAAKFVGPTAGYLFAFPIAAALVGYLAELGLTRTFARAALSMGVGTLVILSIGAIWLSVFFPAEDAFVSGFAMFLPGGALKTLVAASMLPVAWKLAGR
jgi:biotin transport system substrate-specific component